MRQIWSDQISNFAAIYDEDVELVSVTRTDTADCERLFRQLIDARQVPPGLRWIQAANDQEAPRKSLPTSLEPAAKDVLAEQIVEATEVLSELVGCKRIGVRLETLSAPMCPRFHVDHVHCRMLVTLSGSGTEWISNDAVDWDVFAGLSTDTAPLQTGREIQQFDTGNWSLLKGGAWHEQFKGVVHRSPHQPGERLLLALDPML